METRAASDPVIEKCGSSIAIPVERPPFARTEVSRATRFGG